MDDQSERLRGLSPRDIHEQRLMAQDFDFTIPSVSLTYPPDVSEAELERHPLTGLAVENDYMREYLAHLISDATRENKSWMLTLVDADNLKFVNDVLQDHDLGDMVIKYGTARITQAVEAAQLDDIVTVIALRSSGADETIVLIVGQSDEEIVRLQTHIDKINKPKPSTNPDFDFSVSTATITSDDDRLSEILETEQTWIASGNRSDRFYGFVKKLIEHDVRHIKKAKDLARTPIQEILTTNNIHLLIGLLMQRTGNTRIGNELLEVLLKLSSIDAIKALGRNLELQSLYRDLLSRLGISQQRLNELGSPEAIVSVFQELFGKIEPDS